MSTWALPWSHIEREEWRGRSSEGKHGVVQTGSPCIHEAVESLQLQDFEILKITG